MDTTIPIECKSAFACAIEQVDRITDVGQLNRVIQHAESRRPKVSNAPIYHGGYDYLFQDDEYYERHDCKTQGCAEDI